MNEINVQFKYNSKNASFELLNAIGEQVEIRAIKSDMNNYKIIVPAVSKGIYYLVVKGDSSISKTKLIKQ
jgi:hypothetical protein